MYQLSPRGTENSTTLFTSAVTLIDIDDRCSDDIVVAINSQTFDKGKHNISTVYLNVVLSTPMDYHNYTEPANLRHKSRELINIAIAETS